MAKNRKWVHPVFILNKISILQWVDNHKEQWWTLPRTTTNLYNKCNNKLLIIIIQNILQIILNLVIILSLIVVKVGKCIPAQVQHTTNRFHHKRLCLANNQITLQWIILMAKGCQITTRIHFLIRCQEWYRCSIMKEDLQCLESSLLEYTPMMLLWRLLSQRSLEDRVLGISNSRIQCIRIEDL